MRFQRLHKIGDIRGSGEPFPTTRLVEDVIGDSTDGVLWDVSMAKKTSDWEKVKPESNVVVQIYADTADDAIKYSLQWARIQSREDDQYSDLEVLSVERK